MQFKSQRPVTSIALAHGTLLQPMHAEVMPAPLREGYIEALPSQSGTIRAFLCTDASAELPAAHGINNITVPVAKVSASRADEPNERSMQTPCRHPDESNVASVHFTGNASYSKQEHSLNISDVRIIDTESSSGKPLLVDVSSVFHYDVAVVLTRDENAKNMWPQHFAMSPYTARFQGASDLVDFGNMSKQPIESITFCSINEPHVEHVDEQTCDESSILVAVDVYAAPTSTRVLIVDEHVNVSFRTSQQREMQRYMICLHSGRKYFVYYNSTGQDESTQYDAFVSVSDPRTGAVFFGTPRRTDLAAPQEFFIPAAHQ